MTPISSSPPIKKIITLLSSFFASIVLSVLLALLLIEVYFDISSPDNYHIVEEIVAVPDDRVLVAQEYVGGYRDELYTGNLKAASTCELFSK